ncbi:hydrolase [Limisphaera ngatamarikiensis]|uniref:Hydrolase n=1 Tax=Limisphaera ngatamarikiensis TaxID=1324935 RepID=A0A6M1RRX9_9BACT|nr:hydrolase [Limisphaera ngatamarikiensis]NGO38071.1 hydrolase [Limisphaera ngatamarikiensis]
MLDPQTTLVALIDVQERLARVMADQEALITNLRRLIQGAQHLGLPVVWAEQNPTRLGLTVPELRSLLVGQQPVTKMTFNCWADPAFRKAIEATGRRQVLLAGIETHVCIYQTAVALLQAGYEVEVVADAVSSRSAEHRQLALTKLSLLGARPTCVEMALFELLQTAESPAFKAILALVK